MTRTYGNFTDFIDFSRASSGTYLGSDGLIKTAADNVPRVEYDSSGVLKGLLIEEQRTNLVTTSEALSGGNWFNNGGTITENIVTAPDGTLTGSTYSTDGAYRILRNVATVSSSTTYTWSFYAKNIDATSLHYRVYDDTNAADIVVATSYFSDVSTTEWARIVVTFTTPATCTNLGVYVCSGDIGGTAAFWGAQLEAGSFATSYIPTSGATATRSADIADIATANFGYNPKAGTLVVEFALNEGSGSGDPHVLTLSDGTSSNRALLKEDSSQTRFYVAAGGVGQASIYNEVFSENTTVRSAFSLKADNFAVSTNGEAAETDVSGSMPTSITTIALGNDHDGGSQAINGHIKSIKYIPRRNTNNQLQEFTS